MRHARENPRDSREEPPLSLRALKQPGPVAARRFESVCAPLEELEIVLEPGLSLNEAIARPLMAAGWEGGSVHFEDGFLAPFHFVMPAAAPDATHAAWYSQTHSPEGEARIEQANVTFGFRDGAPFTHCHAIWRTADGVRGGGHILPLETKVSRPIRARAWGSRQARIAARPDPETNFTLFTPEADASGPQGGRRLILARLRPNVEIGAALADVCRAHGVERARVVGSLGSIIGATFEEGPDLADYATEFLVLDGTVAPDESGNLQSRLNIAIVGLSGTLREGWLAQGRNSVCITCEFALEADAA